MALASACGMPRWRRILLLWSALIISVTPAAAGVLTKADVKEQERLVSHTLKRIGNSVRGENVTVHRENGDRAAAYVSRIDSDFQLDSFLQLEEGFRFTATATVFGEHSRVTGDVSADKIVLNVENRSGTNVFRYTIEGSEFVVTGPSPLGIDRASADIPFARGNTQRSGLLSSPTIVNEFGSSRWFGKPERHALVKKTITGLRSLVVADLPRVVWADPSGSRSRLPNQTQLARTLQRLLDVRALQLSTFDTLDQGLSFTVVSPFLNEPYTVTGEITPNELKLHINDVAQPEQSWQLVLTPSKTGDRLSVRKGDPAALRPSEFVTAEFESGVASGWQEEVRQSAIFGKRTLAEHGLQRVRQALAKVRLNSKPIRRGAHWLRTRRLDQTRAAELQRLGRIGSNPGKVMRRR